MINDHNRQFMFKKFEFNGSSSDFSKFSWLVFVLCAGAIDCSTRRTTRQTGGFIGTHEHDEDDLSTVDDCYLQLLSTTTISTCDLAPRLSSAVRQERPVHYCYFSTLYSRKTGR
jgi:hypothetical protein